MTPAEIAARLARIAHDLDLLRDEQARLRELLRLLNGQYQPSKPPLGAAA